MVRVVEYVPCRFPLQRLVFRRAFRGDTEEQIALPARAITVVDSDLYESEIEVLRMLGPRLRVGTNMLFDDFNAFTCDDNHGVRRVPR